MSQMPSALLLVRAAAKQAVSSLHVTLCDFWQAVWLQGPSSPQKWLHQSGAPPAADSVAT